MNEPMSEQMDGFNELSLNLMGRDTHISMSEDGAKKMSQVLAFLCSLVSENE